MKQLCTRLLLLAALVVPFSISANYVDLFTEKHFQQSNAPAVIRAFVGFLKLQGPRHLPYQPGELSPQAQKILHRQLGKFGATFSISNVLVPVCIGLKQGYTRANLSSSLKGLALATSGAYAGSKYIAPAVSSHRIGNAALASIANAPIWYGSGYAAGRTLKVMPECLSKGAHKLAALKHALQARYLAQH